MKRQRDLKMKPDERGPLGARQNLPELLRSWDATSVDSSQDGNGLTT